MVIICTSTVPANEVNENNYLINIFHLFAEWIVNGKFKNLQSIISFRFILFTPQKFRVSIFLDIFSSALDGARHGQSSRPDIRPSKRTSARGWLPVSGARWPPLSSGPTHVACAKLRRPWPWTRRWWSGCSRRQSFCDYGFSHSSPDRWCTPWRWHGRKSRRTP